MNLRRRIRVPTLIGFISIKLNTASRNSFRTLVKETMKWLCTSTGWMVRTRNFVNLPYMTVDLLMKFCCMSNHMWCHLLNHWAWTLGLDLGKMSVIYPERAKVWPSRNCKGCKGFSEKTGKTQLKRLGVSHPNHVQIENCHSVVARVKLTTPLEGASLATHDGIQRIIENKSG